MQEKSLWTRAKHKLKKLLMSSSHASAGAGGEEHHEDSGHPSTAPPPAVNSTAQPPAEGSSVKPPRHRSGSRPCPPYAAKSVVGQRFTMEDSWQAVPDLLMVPGRWSQSLGIDQLPVVIIPAQQDTAAVEPATAGDTAAASSQPAEASTSKPLEAPAPAPAAPDVQQLGASTEDSIPTSAHFFAVYDGHGGADVAKHCAKNLHEHLKKVVQHSISAAASAPAPAPAAAADATPLDTPKSPPPEPDPSLQVLPTVDSIEEAMKHAFVKVDSDLATERSAHEVGTTAVVALLGTTRLWVANCGDSRAMLCRDREAVALSSDHKATRSDEVTRVEQAGGYVWWDRVMGELAVSRAIGDHCLRPFVIPEPEVTYVTRRPEDQLLLMASDGLWDVFTNEEARALALEKFRGELTKNSSSKLAVKKAASSLAKAALAKGSRDNITVIVVDVRLSATVVPPVRAQSQAATTDGDASDGDD